MRRDVTIVVGIAAWSLAMWPAAAAEHGGKEHAGATQEHAGATKVQMAPVGGTVEHAGATQQQGSAKPTVASVEPSAEEIRQSIRDYISQIEQEEGSFTIDDEVTGTTRELTLVAVHERVGKTGSAYYSCTDMKDTASGEPLDLDFDVESNDGTLEVVDVRIHKVNGKARYTYDDNDNRVPAI